MNKSIVAIALSSLAFGAAAAHEAPQENINYGDPTASFSTLGASRSNNATQINGMYGAGSNIFQLDLTRADKSGDISYRGRYFHVTDGLGYSVDVIGDKDSTAALGGIIYKIPLTDNVSIFPMLSAGVIKEKDTYTTKVVRDGKGGYALNTTKNNNGDTLIQGGLFALYAFDAGHWLYANPKVTRTFDAKATIPQIELGGGYMVTESVSVGFKIEHTGKFDSGKGAQRVAVKADTVSWFQANYYF